MTSQMEFQTPDEKICHACGAKTIEYPYRFDSTLKGFLVKLARAGGKAHKDSLDLTHSQYGQAHRIKYWKLARMVDEGGIEVIKGGLWELTDLGDAFVNGEVTIRKVAMVMRNQVTRYAGDTIHIEDVQDAPRKKKFYKDQAAAQIAGR